jgi:hypothetical protein
LTRLTRGDEGRHADLLRSQAGTTGGVILQRRPCLAIDLAHQNGKPVKRRLTADAAELSAEFVKQETPALFAAGLNRHCPASIRPDNEIFRTVQFGRHRWPVPGRRMVGMHRHLPNRLSENENDSHIMTRQ